MTSLLAPQAPPTSKPRILVLLDPRAAFASVAPRPLWALAVVVNLAIAVLPPLVFLQKADATAVVRKELTRSGTLDKMPKDQHEQVISIGAKAMVVALPVGAVAKRAIWMTLLSLLIFGLLKGSRPELKLWPVAGAVGVAMAPLMIHDVLVAGIFLFRDVMSLEATNAVLSNPAAFMNLEVGHSVFGALLQGLDFFQLWSAALVGIGANVVAGTRSNIPYFVAFGGHFAVTLMNAVGASFS